MENQPTAPKSNSFYFVFIFLLLAGLAGLTLAWSRQRAALNTCKNSNAELLAELGIADDELKALEAGGAFAP